MEIRHTALWVSDLDRTLEFYVDQLGLEYDREFVGDDGVTNVFVGGDGPAELQFKHGEDGPDVVDSGDYDHVAIGVEDTDAMVEFIVEETEGSLRSGPLTMADAGARIAFVEDPDGYGIELVSELD